MTQYYPLSNSFSTNEIKSQNLAQVMWHITQKCELNCIFCFADKNKIGKETLWSRTQLEETVRLFTELGVQKIDISGGEPLLCEQLIDIVNVCQSHGLNITITTSGQGLPSNKTWLVENSKLFSRVIFSLDGLEPEHNFLRGNNNSYSHCLDLYKSLADAGCEHLRINSVITNMVLNGNYPFLFSEIISKLQPLEWCVIKPHRTGNERAFNQIDISDVQFNNFFRSCAMYLEMNEIKVIERSNNIYSSYWTLNAHRRLILDSVESRYNIPFDFSQIEIIRKAISLNTQFLPKEQ